MFRYFDQVLCCRCSASDQQAALPGCPDTSIARRRWLHHTSCGGTIDPDNPQYYFNAQPYESETEVDYYGAPGPAGGDHPTAGLSEAYDPFLALGCLDPNYYPEDPGGDYPEGATDITCCDAFVRAPALSPMKMLHCCNHSWNACMTR